MHKAKNRAKNKAVVGISCGISGDNVELRRFYGERLAAAGLGWLALPPQEEAMAAAMAGRLDGLVLSGGGDIDPALWGENPRPGYVFERERDRWELALLGAFLGLGKPVLGICRGMQLLNVGLGGSIWQDLSEREAGGELEGGKWAQGRVRIKHQQTGEPEEPWHTVEICGWLGELLTMEQGEAGRVHHNKNNDPKNELKNEQIYTEKTGQIWVNSLHHQGVRRLGQGLLAGAYAADGLTEAVYLAPAEGWALGLQWHPERLSDPYSRRIWQEFANAASAASVTSRANAMRG